jgi:hypothetical protein
MLSTEPKWIEINVEGETTKKKYFGKFQIKPFLTHKERSEATRLAERYMMGIETTMEQRMFLGTLALVTYHIVSVEGEVEWWKEKGLDLYDEAPIYALSAEVAKIQKPQEKEKTE